MENKVESNKGKDPPSSSGVYMCTNMLSLSPIYTHKQQKINSINSTNTDVKDKDETTTRQDTHLRLLTTSFFMTDKRFKLEMQNKRTK